MRTTPPALLAAAVLLALPAPPLLAQPAGESRIRSVTLYPGSATVTRALRVAAGSTSARFACLPAGLDARSLQASAPAPLRVGDIRVQLIERALAPECASALDTRLRAAEDALALARAEADAIELGYGYLKAQAGAVPDAGAAGSSQIGATLEALRRSSEDTLTRLHHSRRRVEEQERALQALQAERGSAPAQVARVSVQLAAPRDAELLLSYQLRGPSWSPGYRAELDTEAARVRLTRLALVSQRSGEDWSAVALTLSTGQPLAAASGALPRPWTLQVLPDRPLAAPAPAPALMAASAARTKQAEIKAVAEDAPGFDAQQSDGAYATQFALPQPTTVASGGAPVTLVLGQQELAAELVTRTAPALGAQAWLVAQLPAPDGVWPAGPVALQRDGAYVGQDRLDMGDAAQWRLGLAFGRDERVVVTPEPERVHDASSGFAGGRTERQIEQAWRVENRHSRPVQLQVLAAAPVSQDERITVESRYEPAPADSAWNQQPGAIAWQQPLAAGASARFAASHRLRWDKELRLRERR